MNHGKTLLENGSMDPTTGIKTVRKHTSSPRRSIARVELCPLEHAPPGISMTASLDDRRVVPIPEEHGVAEDKGFPKDSRNPRVTCHYLLICQR